jgi:hypothetical protein
VGGIFFLLIDIFLFGLLDPFPLSSFIALTTFVCCFITSFISTNTPSLGMGIVEGFFSSLGTFVVGPAAFPLEVGSEDDALLFKLLDLFPLS